jgi:carbamoyltransferase
VRAEHRLPITDAQARTMAEDPDLRQRLNVARSTVPAITHMDFSARLQTVDEDRNPRFHELLRAFFARTGCPVLVNTSFNIRGEPIVCTPENALHCFEATDMDALVLEDCVLHKRELADVLDESARERYRAQFQLD